MKLSSYFEIPEKILYQIRSNCICLRENLGKPKKYYEAKCWRKNG